VFANHVSQRRHALKGACRVCHACAAQCTILLWLSCHAEHLISTYALCSYRLLMLLHFPLQGGLAHGQQAALLRGLACRDFAVAAHRVLDRNTESEIILGHAQRPCECCSSCLAQPRILHPAATHRSLVQLYTGAKAANSTDNLKSVVAAQWHTYTAVGFKNSG